jgi:hypothetical protein
LITNGSGCSRLGVVLEEFDLFGGGLSRLGAAGSGSSDWSAEVSGEVPIVDPESGLLVVCPSGEKVVVFVLIERLEPEV